MCEMSTPTLVSHLYVRGANQVTNFVNCITL
jgi:hypothetical protein